MRTWRSVNSATKYLVANGFPGALVYKHVVGKFAPMNGKFKVSGREVEFVVKVVDVEGKVILREVDLTLAKVMGKVLKFYKDSEVELKDVGRV